MKKKIGPESRKKRLFFVEKNKYISEEKVVFYFVLHK